MNRFLTRFGLSASLFVGVSAVFTRFVSGKPVAEKAVDKRPNVLLIMSDDMGYSDLGCYGSEIHTPNLDKLAARGLRFTQFYNGARCCPTRASLLTGLFPHQTGIGHMETDEHVEAYSGKINKKCVTIAEVMKAGGYNTFMTGKWHVNSFIFDPDGDISNWPVQRGFEKCYGTLRGAGSFYDPQTLVRGNTRISAYADLDYKPEKYYYTDAVTDNTIRFINEQHEESPDKPFFSYVAYTAAHWPLHALEEDIEKYHGKYDVGYDAIRRARFEKMKKLGVIEQNCKYTETVGNWDDCEYKAWEARCMEVYAAMIDRMDQGIGRIVDTLEENGQLDNTIIFFLQDNGACAENIGRGPTKNWYMPAKKPMSPEEQQDRFIPPMYTRDGRPVIGGKSAMPGGDGTYISCGQNWANVSNTPFRQYKHWTHEGGISTPLIVHWPAGIDKKYNGKLRSQTSQLMDIMATCVDLGNADYPIEYNGNKIHPMEGVSLAPAFNSDKPLDREALYWEHEGNRAIRMGDWKLVSKAFNHAERWDAVEVLPLDGWELFNIPQDRAELNDLSGKYPEKVKEMADKWHKWALRAMAYPKPNRNR